MVSFKKLRKMVEINGNGNIVSKEIQVSTFIRLHLGCKGVVELHQGDEEKVVVEADENLIQYFAATNAGRTLYVSTQENIVRQPVFTKCVIKVFLRQMNMLYVRNVNGNVVCPDAISLNEPLEVKIQSVGNTELNVIVPALKILCQANGNTVIKGKCEKADFKTQCSGDFDSSKLLAGDLSISNMANGNVTLHADRTIRITHYGNGFVHYSGDANVKDVKQYGNGEIKHVKSIAVQ
jgi:hypothetical protein